MLLRVCAYTFINQIIKRDIKKMISFGPIPSRRLGKSLGINNIPGRKICSYSCIYCQVGNTKEYRTICEPFFEPDVIFAEVKAHLKKLNERDKPDYLTFVANGEPTIKSLFHLRMLLIELFKARALAKRQCRLQFGSFIST